MRRSRKPLGWLLSVALVGVMVQACGGSDGAGSVAGLNDAGTASTPTGSGGRAMQNGTGGWAAQTGSGGRASQAGSPTTGTGGANTAPTCVAGQPCAIELSQLRQGEQALLTCTDDAMTCYCSPSQLSSAALIEGLMSGKSIPGEWTCVANNTNENGTTDPLDPRGGRGEGGYRNDDNQGGGRNQGDIPGPTMGTGGSRIPGNIGNTGGSVGSTGGSTGTGSPAPGSGCPTTKPTGGAVCTTDGYFCDGCMCASGVWNCF